MSEIRVTLLGQFRVTDGDVELLPASMSRVQSLVAFLALNRGVSLPRHRIAFALWPDSTDRQARANLRKVIFQLRQVFPEHPAIIDEDTSMLRWREDGPCHLDVAEFEACAAQAAALAGDREASRVWLIRAVDAYGGDLLPSFYEEWVLPERHRLHEMFLRVLDRLVSSFQEAGEFEQAIVYAKQLVRVDPLQEIGYRRLIRLHALAGDRAAAIATYHTCTVLLRRELGVEPDQLTREAFIEALVKAGSADVSVRASTEPLPTRLPRAVSTFIGRKQELGAIRAILDAGRSSTSGGSTHRLLTLTGVGGGGKSRLALQVASTAAGDYPDGVYWINIAAVREARFIPMEVATALDVRETAGRHLIEAVVGHLEPKHALLVLDNCEHVRAGCASLVGKILMGCPRVQIIVTSREPLEISNERVWHVPPMSLPRLPTRRTIIPRELGENNSVAVVSGGLAEALDSDAVRLFVERASELSPAAFALDPDVASIVGICARLEGIPLAIELAAARINVMTPNQIARRLDAALHVLRRPMASSSPRHRTLQAALDWSYDLLSGVEKAMLRRLAVFVDGFTLDAAEIVCSDSRMAPDEHGQNEPVIHSDDVLDLLSDLVEKSLVVADIRAGNEARYRLLEPIQQYAQERLLGPEREQVELAHASYFVKWSRRVQGDGVSSDWSFEYMVELQVEKGNLLSAVAWSEQQGADEQWWGLAAPLARLLVAQGQWRAVSDLTKRALADPSTDSASHEYMMVLDDLGTARFRTGDLRGARTVFERGLTMARRMGDPERLASALTALAVAEYYVGRETEARTLLVEGVDVARAGQNPVVLQYLLVDLAAFYLYHDNIYVQLCLEEAQTLEDHVGGWLPAARGSTILACLALSQGDLPEAETYIERGLAAVRQLGVPQGEAVGLCYLGRIAQARGEYSVAEQLLAESLALSRQVSDAPGTVRALRSLADLALATVRDDAADKFLAEALGIARQVGYGRAIRDILGLMVVRACCQNDLRRAASYVREQEKRSETNNGHFAWTRYNQALVAGLKGDVDAARNCLADSLRWRARLGEKIRVVECLELFAWLWVGRPTLQAFAARQKAAQPSLGLCLRAARLLAAAEAWRHRLGAPLSPACSSTHEQVLAELHRQADAGAIASVWDEGRNFSLESAIIYSLDDATEEAST